MRLIGILVSALIGLVLIACHASAPAMPAKPLTSAARAVKASSPTPCTKAAPTSAQGYTTLFSALDANYWGGADSSLSVKMPSGLVVWLYSDTISHKNGFVHNSAIVQDRGCLHISYAGRQLVPNENEHLIYWVDSAKAVSNTIVYIRMQQVKIGTANAWDFHATGIYSVAKVTITANHNAHFDAWVSKSKGVATVTPYTKNLVQCAVRYNGKVLSYPTHSQLCPTNPKGEYSYNPQVHPWVRLTSGKLLVTICFNNSDSLTHFDHYRPRFYEIP